MSTANQNTMDSPHEEGPTDPFRCNPAKETALRELCARTGYALTQENGQRKYGGPPPGWNDPVPGKGCEIFVGKLPRDLYEDELVPVLERCGNLYELRLMMDFNGNNRGFAFVKYCMQSDAKRALKELNNFEVRKGRLLGVCKSVDNCRLFVGGIPKSKQKKEILIEMQKLTEGVVDAIVYPSAADKTKNRGFAFVEYQDHHTAAMARRKLMHNRPQLWGHQIAVDWAEPEVEVDDDVMAQVKILYIRNLMLNTTDESLEKMFKEVLPAPGAIERVKKIRDYAFIHFNTRENALKCMRSLQGQTLDGARLEISLAKPVDRETYVRYTRASNRQAEVSEVEQLAPAGYPFVQATLDPATLAAYQAAYPGAVYYNPYATAPAIPGVPMAQRIQAGSLAFQGRPIQIGGIPHIGAAGVPLGIPGASSGVPGGVGIGRGFAARGRGRGAAARPVQQRGYFGRGYAPSSTEVSFLGGEVVSQVHRHKDLVKTKGIPLYNMPCRTLNNEEILGNSVIPRYGMMYYRRPLWHPPQTQVVSGLVERDVKYDLLPDMELIPINPQSIKHINQQKSQIQLLEELCKKKQWGSPDYQLHTVDRQNGLQPFIYRVSIQELSPNPSQPSPGSTLTQPLPPQQQSTPKVFTPTKLSTSLEIAKEIAAEYVLQLLNKDLAPDSTNSDANNNTGISPLYLGSPQPINGHPVTNGLHSPYPENDKGQPFHNFALTNGAYNGNGVATSPDIYY